jgi:hypothetical protein
MSDELKREQVEVRAGILELMADEEDHMQELKEAYAYLPRDAWVNQVAQNVVKHEGYDRLDPVEAASQLALTTEVADLVKERLMRRFELIVCASSSVFPYVDAAGEYKAVNCETHTFNVPFHSSEAIADTLAALIRLTAKDEDDTLFIHKLVTPIKQFSLSALAGAEVEAQRPRFQTRFASVRRKA